MASSKAVVCKREAGFLLANLPDLTAHARIDSR